MKTKKVDCPRCGGTAEEPGAPVMVDMVAKCDQCGGTGTVEVGPTKKNVAALVEAAREALGERDTEEVMGMYYCRFCGRDYGAECPDKCEAEDCPAVVLRAAIARVEGRT